MIYLYGLIAGVCAVGLEYMFKQTGEYWKYFYITLPGALLINYCVFQLVSLSPSLPSAFIVFGTMTMTCRIILSVYAGHEIGNLTWLASGLYFLALGLRELEKHL